MPIFYMHGFASSPFGQKITILQEKLMAEKGINLLVPDLNVPSFAELRLTSIIEKIAEQVELVPSPVYIIASSFGGLATLHFYDRYRDTAASKVAKILFLAPAFNALSGYNVQIARWKQNGSLPIKHFHYGETIDVHYGLIEDLQQYDAYSVKFDLPAVIIHGKNDEAVPYQTSIDFAKGKPNVQLMLVDDNHSLMDSLDLIWQQMTDFFRI